MKKTLDVVGENPVYLSIDIDGNLVRSIAGPRFLLLTFLYSA